MKNRMLFLTATIILSLTTMELNAQFLRFGPRIGVSSSKVQVDERFTISNQTVTYETGDAKLGFHIGAFGRIQIKSWSIQPELLFTSAGGNILITEEGTNETDVRELVYNKMDIPIMLGKSFDKNFRIQAGPAFSFLLSDDARNVDLQEEIEQNYNNSTVGYQVGVGLELGDLSIDLKYEGNLSKLGKSITIDNRSLNTDLRNNQLILSIGLNLL
ncbi:MAG: porin family protein [Bacteroidota bacterium]